MGSQGLAMSYQPLSGRTSVEKVPETKQRHEAHQLFDELSKPKLGRKREEMDRQAEQGSETR